MFEKSKYPGIPILDDEMIEQLQDLENDSPGFALALIKALENELERIKSTFKSGNEIESIRKIAHKLAGASGNLGGKRLSCWLLEIELVCNSNSDDIDDKINELVEYWEEIVPITFTKLYQKFRN